MLATCIVGAACFLHPVMAMLAAHVACMQACTQITLAAAVPSSVSYSRIFKCALRLRLDHEFGRGGARPSQYAQADQVC